MKLKSLALHSLPGFERRGFEIIGIHPGLNVVIGPNASGKTTICQAVRRLLWPERAKYLTSAYIHSEWLCNEDMFTIVVKDGNLIPIVSQQGRSYIERLPEEYLVPCFSMTIDELFDGKDLEFAQRISREIAGGYDVEAAQKCFTPSVSAKSAIKEWKEAEKSFTEYKQNQDKLRQESEGLPALELAIEEAKSANFNVSDLDKIIKLKIVKNKISVSENHLKEFPQQLIQLKIKATDWKSYEQLLEKRESLRKKFESLQEIEKSLEAVGKWREISLAEGELEHQIDRIGRIQGLQIEKHDAIAAIAKLESSLKKHRYFLGISTDEDIENIRAEHLDNIEVSWEALEQLNSKILGIEAQIHLNDVEKNMSSEALAQAAQLLAEIASNTHTKSIGLWIITGITFAIAGTLFFFLTDWMRLFALSLFVPLGFLWIGIFRKEERTRMLRSHYLELGLPPLNEWTSSTILKQLHLTVTDWAAARQVDIQLQRKKDLESSLEPEINQQTDLRANLVNQAQAAGISGLPSTRYRFADFLRSLHEDWIKLKAAYIDLKIVSDSLSDEWGQWLVFANLFEETSTNVYELAKIHARIKGRIDGVEDLKTNSTALETNKKNSNDLEKEIIQLLTRTECLENPDYLQTLVDQLEKYRSSRIELEGLKNQFDELSSELGPKRAARIQEEMEDLEKEKTIEQEKAEASTELSEKKGSLKARIKQMETASEGDDFLRDQNEKFEVVRIACRDFAKKELMGFLVSEAQKDFQRECQPPVLEKAIDWFQRFTKNKFKLEAPTTHTGSIVYEVIDTSTGERRTLDQLSRGTRMQLLMSVRLAFAFQNEKKDGCLPIFLDEVLANTDPERFDAIAEVIGELVGSGRQVFYLTCNPEDAWKWIHRCPSVHLIDLAKIQGQQAFLAAPLPISREDLRFPKPSSQSLDEYARELKLPAFRIDEPIEMVSIHYLVDSTSDLYRLMDSGIETYGNLKHSRSDLIENGFPEGAALIARRGQLLEQFFVLKTRGRGKSLSREALVEGGISKTFIDRIWNLAQEQNCDAKKLIEFLEDKNQKDDRKKGLSAEVRENLKGYLIQERYLDERPILNDNEIRCEFLPMTIKEQDRLFIEKLLAHTTTKEGE